MADTTTNSVDRVADGPPAAPTNGQFLLGLFIVVNIGFLFAINVLGFIKDLGWLLDEGSQTSKLANRLALDLPRQQGHALEAYRLAQRWGEVTAQSQCWCLFAPVVADAAAFAEIEVRWDDRLPGSPPATGARQPLLLLNADHPPDLTSYVRWGYSRLRKYENNVVARIYRKEGEPEAVARERWARSLRATFQDQSDTMRAYLGWRWRLLREEHPDMPSPRQLILRSRSYRIPPPDRDPWMWEGPVVTAVARWRPEQAAAIEMFDPRSQTFLSSK